MAFLKVLSVVLPFSLTLLLLFVQRVTAHFLPGTFLLHAPQQSGGSLACAVPKGAQPQGPQAPPLMAA